MLYNTCSYIECETKGNNITTSVIKQDFNKYVEIPKRPVSSIVSNKLSKVIKRNTLDLNKSELCTKINPLKEISILEDSKINPNLTQIKRYLTNQAIQKKIKHNSFILDSNLNRPNIITLNPETTENAKENKIKDNNKFGDNLISNLTLIKRYLTCNSKIKAQKTEFNKSYTGIKTEAETLNNFINKENKEIKTFNSNLIKTPKSNHKAGLKNLALSPINHIKNIIKAPSKLKIDNLNTLSNLPNNNLQTDNSNLNTDSNQEKESITKTTPFDETYKKISKTDIYIDNIKEFNQKLNKNKAENKIRIIAKTPKQHKEILTNISTMLTSFRIIMLSF